MTLKKIFQKHFLKENLKRIYLEHIVISHATGIDNITHSKFRPVLDEHISIISRKTLAGTYFFTKFKLKLISKGRGKPPREVSIPTIRDRITLRALCDFLSESYQKTLQAKLPQNIIRDIKRNINLEHYTGFIRLDIKDFYPSIQHDILIRQLKTKIRNNSQIIDLINRAIETPTIFNSSKSNASNKLGVPQGLSISNILASIYLIKIDKAINCFQNIKYYRYVDDILILCNIEEEEEIITNITKEFAKVSLHLYLPGEHSEKAKKGELKKEDFYYLGYHFKPSLVSVKDSSIEKLKESIVAIFTAYKHSALKNTSFLLWRLNLRITGCIYEKKHKGWLLFFSEITDEGLLHKLDHYVENLVERFGVSISPKKFVRAYFDILYNHKYQTSYIPNFDQYEIHDMKDVLQRYFNKETTNLSDDEIKREFQKRISKEVKDLLTDIKGNGSLPLA